MTAISEVLPAKQTPLTDAATVHIISASGARYPYVLTCFARTLELERAALLALVERVAELTDGNIGPVRADARALLAQLSGNAPACVSTASEDRA